MSTAQQIAAIQAELETFSTYVYLFQQQIAVEMDLHPTDFHSIHLLDKYGTLTAGQLATQLGLTSGATTAAVDRLVVLGYVERIPSDTDRRSTVLRLRTEATQKLKQKYAAINLQVQDGLGNFTAVELKTIVRFLQTMTKG